MGVDDIDLVPAHESGDAEGVQDAARYRLLVDRHRGVGLSEMKLVGNPKNVMLASPRVRQGQAVSF
jgi:hypothetical protein